MGFSDNLMTIEKQPWMFRSILADTYLSEAFSRDTETITKALQKSISNQYLDDFTNDVFNPFHHAAEATTTTTPIVSGGSESETDASKKRKTAAGFEVNGEKGTKRRSRASKRETTTYIAADPKNFRQLVQQVTGGGDHQLPVVQIHKPEPHRISNNSLLPTLDTSAFLLDQVNHPPPMSLDQVLMAQPSAADSGLPSDRSQPEWEVADGGSATTLDFDFLCNFPILESNVF